MKMMKTACVLALAAQIFLPAAGDAFAADYKGKKVLYIDSYHEGYAWSDGIMKGIKDVLGKSGVELKMHLMDTKRNGAPEFAAAAGEKAKAEIEAFKPDVVIACDDNASKHIIAKFYKDAETPFVFCGVNWDAGVYGYPYKNVTGMVEVIGIREMLDLIKDITPAKNIVALTADTETERKDIKYSQEKFGLKFDENFVKTFAEWKEKFKEVQDKGDLLVLQTNAGINDWNDAEAKAWVMEHAKIPSVTSYAWMMPYALIGYTKLAEEQGEWAAQAALKILGGTSPKDIPIVQNKKGGLYVNSKLAQKLNVKVPAELLSSAEIVE